MYMQLKYYIACCTGIYVAVSTIAVQLLMNSPNVSVVTLWKLCLSAVDSCWNAEGKKYTMASVFTHN